jgi:hypothetical protein
MLGVMACECEQKPGRKGDDKDGDMNRNFFEHVFGHAAISSRSRPRPLVACLAVAFALATPAAKAATTWVVDTCNEGISGNGTVGSLRFAIANAASADTIDMTGLTCSSISLQTGALTITQDSLTLRGPGMDRLSITGRYNGATEHDRIFLHTGSGTLDINDLSVGFGYLYNASGNANGGCINSSANVMLNRVAVYGCIAKTGTGHWAQGGGVFVTGQLSMNQSTLESNLAIGAPNSFARGGGAFVCGAFDSNDSTIDSNLAGSASVGSNGYGGGLNLGGNVTIRGSTISGNTSGKNHGGIDIFSWAPAYQTVIIANSTISGNTATNVIGGIYSNAGTITLQNSTVAFNSAGNARYGTAAPFSYYAPGISLAGVGGTMSVTLQGTLAANNTYGSGAEYDLSSAGQDTFVFAGSNNLVRVTHTGVSADTSSCPLLGPLRDNGGATKTHALLSRSAGIDAGSSGVLDPATNAPYAHDQRGSPFGRVSGVSADIGAYEVDQGDVVFNSSLEGCS